MTEYAPPSPYIGPVPFGAENRDFFFGRDYEISEVKSLVLSSQVLVVHSPSGAGMTSLISAGVLPLLRALGLTVLGPTRVKAGLTPSHPALHGNVFVANLLADWTTTPCLSHEMHPGSLREFLAAGRRADAEGGEFLPRVMVLDQVEEVFTAHPERWRDRAGLFAELGESLRDFPDLRLVLLLREDFLAAFEALAHLLPGGARDRFRLELLRPEAALDAVRRPAQLVRERAGGHGPAFADGVAEQLVDDLLLTRVDDGTGEISEVRGEFVEPVTLQVVCQRLWQALPPRVDRITREHLRRHGNIDGALSCFYEDVVRRAAGPDVDDARLRTWVQDVLITDIGTRNMAYASRGSVSGMPDRVVRKLEAEHLVRAEWRAGLRWYELTHDRLIPAVLRANERHARRDDAADVDELRSLGNRLLARAQEKQAVGDLAGAEQKLARAVALFQRVGDPSSEAECWLSRGDVALLDFRLDDADHCYAQAQRLLRGAGSVSESQAYIGRGLVRVYRDEPAAALGPLREATRVDPGNGWAYKCLGDALLEIGEFAEAREAYRSAVDRTPDDAAVRRGWHDVLLLTGDEEAARADAAAFQQGRSGDVEAALLGAHLHLALAEFGAAARFAHHAITLDPMTPVPCGMLAHIELRRCRYEEAVRVGTLGLDRAPHEAWMLTIRAQALLATGRVVEALSDLDEALDRRTTEYWLRYCRGVAHAHNGDADSARLDLAVAIDGAAHQHAERPRSWRTGGNLLVCRLAAGQVEQAEELFRHVRNAPRVALLEARCDLDWLLRCWPPDTPGADTAARLRDGLAEMSRA